MTIAVFRTMERETIKDQFHLHKPKYFQGFRKNNLQSLGNEISKFRDITRKCLWYSDKRV